MACIIHQWKALFLYFLTVYYVSTLQHLTRSEMYTLNGQWCLTTGGAKVVVYTVGCTRLGLLGVEFAKLYRSENATELCEQWGYAWKVFS